MPGIVYTAVTCVRHPADLVFEEDLPSWEVFQSARSNAGFRARLRFDFRCAVLFSKTLRKYGFCEADSWEESETRAAAALLHGLRVVGSMRRGSMGGKVLSDEDAHLWPDGEPDFDEVLRRVVVEQAGGDVEREGFLMSVAQRLRGDLHMPAVREALGCLIPVELHPNLDGRAARARGGGGEDRVGVRLEAGRWKVDVGEVAMLSMAVCLSLFLSLSIFLTREWVSG